MRPIRTHAARLALLLALFLELLLAQSAVAQISPFRKTNAPQMNKADLAQLNDATQRLNEKNPAVVGSQESWQGDVSGTVRLDRIYRQRGTMCHAVSYRLHRATGATQVYRLNWCKAPDGSWKTVG